MKREELLMVIDAAQEVARMSYTWQLTRYEAQYVDANGRGGLVQVSACCQVKVMARGIKHGLQRGAEFDLLVRKSAALVVVVSMLTRRNLDCATQCLQLEQHHVILKL